MFHIQRRITWNHQGRLGRLLQIPWTTQQVCLKNRVLQFLPQFHGIYIHIYIYIYKIIPVVRHAQVWCFLTPTDIKSNLHWTRRFFLAWLATWHILSPIALRSHTMDGHPIRWLGNSIPSSERLPIVHGEYLLGIWVPLAPTRSLPTTG